MKQTLLVQWHASNTLLILSCIFWKVFRQNREGNVDYSEETKKITDNRRKYVQNLSTLRKRIRIKTMIVMNSNIIFDTGLLSVVQNIKISRKPDNTNGNGLTVQLSSFVGKCGQNGGGAVANWLRRRTSYQTVLGSNPAVAAALIPWTRLFTPIVPRRSLHISFY